jgi:hypothetical protein
MRGSLPVYLAIVCCVGIGLLGCSESSSKPEQYEANHAPGVPTIDTAGGAPDDGETGCSISETLHWQCSDPDGDALTYDVYFGQTNPPVAVSTGQAAMSYDPGALQYDTDYYWKIVAEDQDNETASSDVWSFTTMTQPTETVSTPDIPTGPAGGETMQSLAYTTGGATSNLGHSVEYRFDWGDGSYSAWAVSTSESHSWSTAGTYSIKAQARCASHTGVESAWSAAADVVISEAAEIVTTPGDVSGPATGTTIQTLNYSTTSPAISNLGHVVEYRYDWGDGSYSSWSVSNGASHNWTAAGSYEVRAQARCRDHISVVSDWTAALTVTITEVTETVTKPTITTHPEYVDLGDQANFVAQYASSNLGHSLEYQWDYGDGTISSWEPLSGSYSLGAHSYSVVGAYEVKARARCAVHTDVESDWSNAVTVNVVAGAETVSTPYIYEPDTEEEKTIQQGESITLRQTGASSNLGHELEYRFDFGDGYISPWSWEYYATYSGYGAIGDYEVKAQARCRDHIDIESAWSDAITIHVLLAESITRPDVSGPATGVVGELITFTTSGSTSDLGHDLEYRLYISTSSSSLGNPTDWTTMDNLTYTFTQARTWYVRVQARCVTHTYAESPPSYPPHSIVISNP